MVQFGPVGYLLFYLLYGLCAAYLLRFCSKNETHLPPRYWVLFSAAVSFSAVVTCLSIVSSFSIQRSAATAMTLCVVNFGLILLIYYLTYLVSENYAEVLQENPALVTTKKDRAYHGIGLSVVRSIVSKYRRDLQIQWENGCFCVTVMLLCG